MSSGEYTLIASDSELIIPCVRPHSPDSCSIHEGLHRAPLGVTEDTKDTKALPPLPSSDHGLRHDCATDITLQGVNASFTGETTHLQSENASENHQLNHLEENTIRNESNDNSDALPSALLNVSIKTYADATNIANLYPELAPTVLTMPLPRKSISLPEPPRKELSAQMISAHSSQMTGPGHSSDKPNWAVASDTPTDSVSYDIDMEKSSRTRATRSNKDLPPSLSRKKGAASAQSSKNSPTEPTFRSNAHGYNAKNEHGHTTHEAPDSPFYMRSIPSSAVGSHQQSNFRDKPLPPQPIPSYVQPTFDPTAVTHDVVDRVQPRLMAPAWAPFDTNVYSMIGAGSHASENQPPFHEEVWLNLNAGKAEKEIERTSGLEDDGWRGSLPASAYGGRSERRHPGLGRGRRDRGASKHEKAPYNQWHDGDQQRPPSDPFAGDYSGDYDEWTGSLPASAYGAMPSSRRSASKRKGRGAGAGSHFTNQARGQNNFRSQRSDFDSRVHGSVPFLDTDSGAPGAISNLNRDHSSCNNRGKPSILGPFEDVGAPKQDANAGPVRSYAGVPRDVPGSQSVPHPPIHVKHHGDESTTIDAAMDTTFWQNILDAWNTDLPKTQLENEENVTQHWQEPVVPSRRPCDAPSSSSSAPIDVDVGNQLLDNGAGIYSPDPSSFIGPKAQENEQRRIPDRTRVEAQVAGVIAATQKYLSSAPTSNTLDREIPLNNEEFVGHEARTRVADAVKGSSSRNTTSSPSVNNYSVFLPRSQGGRNLIRTPPEEVPSGWHQERSASSSASSTRGRPTPEATNFRVPPSAKCGAPPSDGDMYFAEDRLGYVMRGHTASNLLQDVHQRINTDMVSINDKMGVGEAMEKGGDSMMKTTVATDVNEFEKENTTVDIAAM
ncbi:hypothetical protein EV360DRAFT_75778 [Lentinula raphanica]|nr:hypothetical protein EV360DRAFT_75778 [Lentinula raphanica]